MNHLQGLAWSAFFSFAFFWASADAEEFTGVKVLPQVNVEGRAPMPLVWRVASRGHTLLVIGTVSPVPTTLDWHAGELDRLIASANAIVLPPKGVLKLGWLGRSALVSSLSHVRLPDGNSLASFISGDDLHQLIEANRQFNRGDKSLLSLKPGNAAIRLRNAAIKALDLQPESPVYDHLKASARDLGVPLISTRVRFKVDDPSEYAHAINGERFEDVQCLVLLVRLLAERPEAFRERAEAWADGSYVTGGDRVNTVAKACRASLHPDALLAEHGVIGLEKQLRQAWIKDVTTAMGRGRLIVAAVPITNLSAYLAALRRLGFTVTGPTVPSDTDLDLSPSR